MFFTRALYAVLNTKGGRQWNKPWGIPKVTRTQKANRRKNKAIFNQNMSVLKMAAAMEPEVPVRLYKPLPEWQRAQMVRIMERTKQQLNWKHPGGLVAAAAQQQQQRHQQTGGRQQ